MPHGITREVIACAHSRGCQFVESLVVAGRDLVKPEITRRRLGEGRRT
jgi:hypothetical protein